MAGKIRNIGLWPVRPADILSAVSTQRVSNAQGTQTWKSMFLTYQIFTRLSAGRIIGELSGMLKAR